MLYAPYFNMKSDLKSQMGFLNNLNENLNFKLSNGNKANFRVKTIYSGKRSIHYAR